MFHKACHFGREVSNVIILIYVLFFWGDTTLLQFFHVSVLCENDWIKIFLPISPLYIFCHFVPIAEYADSEGLSTLPKVLYGVLKKKVVGPVAHVEEYYEEEHGDLGPFHEQVDRKVALESSLECAVGFPLLPGLLMPTSNCRQLASISRIAFGSSPVRCLVDWSIHARNCHTRRRSGGFFCRPDDIAVEIFFIRTYFLVRFESVIVFHRADVLWRLQVVVQVWELWVQGVVYQGMTYDDEENHADAKQKPNIHCFEVRSFG